MAEVMRWLQLFPQEVQEEILQNLSDMGIEREPIQINDRVYWIPSEVADLINNLELRIRNIA
jgi:predicted AAA+ superfamily ATPase